jgi:hypothetical protein
MKRFGPGELHGWVRLDQPTALGKHARTIVRHTQDCRQFIEQSGDLFPDPAWFTQLVYFASSGGGDWYCWDPSDISHRTLRECRCYCLRHGNEHRPIAAGDSFWGFVQWVDADVRSWRERDPSDDDEPGIAFDPYFMRKKKVPAKKSVKLWLVFNNNTVRDLALAIHDHGRAEAFPVLADALEEADCANADVLDSCRRGDPDIDGLWVLRVLLGEG